MPDGTMADEYVKRNPVPGDPHDAGTAHARVISFKGLKFSGGICYDYSFPSIARDNANDGADIALLPASDWKGIDFTHSHMARMHAVAVGLPIMRPVRASTSIATDQYGRILGSLPWQGSGDGVFVVPMRGERVPTIYSKTGELLPLISLGFTILVLIKFIRVKRRTII
jgi:apolipoprotein N-acyltransferase